MTYCLCLVQGVGWLGGHAYGEGYDDLVTLYRRVAVQRERAPNSRPALYRCFKIALDLEVALLSIDLT